MSLRSAVCTLLTLFTFSTVIIQTNSNLFSTPNLHIEPDAVVLAKWNDLGPKFQKLAKAYSNTVWSAFNRTSRTSKVSSECIRGVNRMFTDFINLKMWAVEMVDATGYHGGGMLFNNWFSMGDFEHCIDIRGPKLDDRDLIGQYCVVHLRPPMARRINSFRIPDSVPALDNLTTEFELIQSLKSRSYDFYERSFRYGVCIPSTCTGKDLELFAGQVSKELGLNAEVKDCQTVEKDPFEPHHKYILYSLLAFATIVILTSFLPGDANSKTILGTIKKTFSFTHHMSQLLTPPKHSDPKSSHINGLKCLATVWTIVIHYLLVGLFARGYHGHEKTKLFTRSFFNQISANSIISVDTFFFSTAVILAYIKFRKGVPVKSGVGFSALSEITIPIIRRYLRILPMCLVIIGIMFLLPFAGEGPLYKEVVGSYNEQCVKTWWKILYFGTNFEKPDEQCAFHFWYISCDLQLFIFFAIFSFCYCRNQRLGYYFLVVSSVLSTIYTGLKAYIYDEEPTILFRNIEHLQETLARQYESPFSHMSVYSLGIATGICLTKIKQVKLSKLTLLGGWFTSFLIFYYVIFSSYEWNNGILPSPLEAVLYVVFSKFLWAVSHSWLVIVCATGNFESLNKFLSSPMFDFGGRIMFSFYVSNIPLIFYFIASNQSLVDLRYANLWSQALLMVVLVSIASFFAHVIYERPLAELVSYITPNEAKQPPLPNNPKELEKQKDVLDNISNNNLPPMKNKNI